MASSFFLFLGCISYSILVNIMSLSGTQPKKEPLVDKGSKTATFSGVCSFLYILDMMGFSLQVVGEMMHKKHTFYTYAYPQKNSLYTKSKIKIRLFLQISNITLMKEATSLANCRGCFFILTRSASF